MQNEFLNTNSIKRGFQEGTKGINFKLNKKKIFSNPFFFLAFSTLVTRIKEIEKKIC
jgi:hypothetical protein